MRYDFSNVEDQQSFVSIPEGTYVCKVADVRPGLARDGSERWRFRLEVCEGDWSGRTASWDSLTWSERGIFRVKRVLAAFGFDTQGELEVHPGDLLGRRARVQLELENWEDPVTGTRKERLQVPYLGYMQLGGEGGGDAAQANGRARGDSEGRDDFLA